MVKVFLIALGLVFSLVYYGSWHDSHHTPFLSGPNYYPINEGCHFRDHVLVLCYRVENANLSR